MFWYTVNTDVGQVPCAVHCGCLVDMETEIIARKLYTCTSHIDDCIHV